MAHADKFHACEDIHLVEASGGGTYLFAACLGLYENRGRVQSHMRVTEGEEVVVPPAVRDKFWRWELESDEVVELELVGFPSGADRAWHGTYGVESI